MQFAPFSFLSPQQALGPAITNPNEIADLTFWVDFSDTDFLEIINTGSADYVNKIFSKVSGSTSHTLNPIGVNNTSNFGGPGPAWMLVTSSLSKPSLNCGKIVQRPTTYWATNWNGTSNDAIVQGPKTNTTSYPDGMTFMVLNRTYNDNLGYLIARFNGSTDKGAFFTENRTGGSYPPKTPQLTIGSYDFGGGIDYFDGSNNDANLILTRENNGVTRTLFLGNTQVGTDSGNDTQNRTHRQFNSLGRYSNGSTTSTAAEHPPIDTYYCEVIQYNRVLTSEERTKVWNYLSNKWNISL